MTMAKTLEQMMQEVGPARRKRVEGRAAQLIADVKRRVQFNMTATRRKNKTPAR